MVADVAKHNPSSIPCKKAREGEEGEEVRPEPPQGRREGFEQVEGKAEEEGEGEGFGGVGELFFVAVGGEELRAGPRASVVGVGSSTCSACSWVAICSIHGEGG